MAISTSSFTDKLKVSVFSGRYTHITFDFFWMRTNGPVRNSTPSSRDPEGGCVSRRRSRFRIKAPTICPIYSMRRRAKVFRPGRAQPAGGPHFCARGTWLPLTSTQQPRARTIPERACVKTSKPATKNSSMGVLSGLMPVFYGPLSGIHIQQSSTSDLRLLNYVAGTWDRATGKVGELSFFWPSAVLRGVAVGTGWSAIAHRLTGRSNILVGSRRASSKSPQGPSVFADRSGSALSTPKATGRSTTETDWLRAIHSFLLEPKISFLPRPFRVTFGYDPGPGPRRLPTTH